MISRDTIQRGFPIKPLGEVAEFLDSRRRPITASERIPGPYPYYGANGQQDSVADYIFDESLILLAEDGGPFDQPDRGIAYVIEGKTWVNNHAHVLRPRGHARLRYLFRVLENYDVTPWITGSTRAKLTKAGASEIEIPLPPLNEQKRIAGILDAADALRAKRREALAQLDTLIQSTFLDMFGDPVSNPMGWEVKPLNELLGGKSTNGAYYPKGAYSSVGTRMVHMANAFYGVVNPNEVKRVDAPLADIEKYGLLPTDILVCRRSLNYEGSAKPCLIPETDEPLIFESSLIRVRPDRERVLTIYLFHYLLNDRARAKYVFPLVTRSTISGISQSNLMKVKVVLPPLDLQHRFAAIVQSVEQQKTGQRTHLAELDTLFAALQSRAVRGDL